MKFAKIANRVLAFICFLSLSAGITWFFFGTDLMEYYNVLRWGGGSECYLKVAHGKDDDICLARWENRSRHILNIRFYSHDGKRLENWSVAVPQNADKLSTLCPYDRETVLLGFYLSETDEVTGDTADKVSLAIYSAHKSGELTPLFCEDCKGGTGMERAASLYISSCQTGINEIDVAVIYNDEILKCVWDSVNDVMSRTDMGDGNGALCAAILPDGSLVTGGNGYLSFTDRSVVLNGQMVMNIEVTGKGLYYTDTHNAQICFSDFKGNEVYTTGVFHDRVAMSTTAFGRNNCRLLTDWSVTDDGDLLCLQDGNTVFEAQSDGVREIPVHTSTGTCVAYMVLAALGTLLFTMLLYAVFFIIWKGKVSLALHWGFVIVAASFAFWCFFTKFYIGPNTLNSILEMRRDFAVSAINTVFSDDYKNSDELRVIRIAQMLERTGYRDVSVYMLKPDENGWVTELGFRAETLSGFSEDLMEKLKNDGRDSLGYIPEFDTSIFWLCEKLENHYVLVNSASVSEIEIKSTVAYRTAGIVLVALGALMITCLLAIHSDVKKLARGVERYSGDQEWKDVALGSDDELEGMASTMNALARERETQRRENNRLVESYRRFVPEQVLSLMGKSTILEVDKSTVASRRVAFLSVRFHLPDEYYSNGGRRIFEEVNHVLEQTVEVVSKKDGTVFNFTNNGYDVVMEAEPELAASTAVAISQAALSMNAQAEESGRPKVKLRIALDMDEMTLGVVGNEELLMPVAISSSLVRLEEMLKLCESIDANILCTEGIAQGARDYGSRYVGKCRVDGADVRVNELFDGDDYELRKSKLSSVKRFSEAVLLLYGGSVVQAKRIFLELVHESPSDGAARYYLYLADRMQHVPETPCRLSGALADIAADHSTD